MKLMIASDIHGSAEYCGKMMEAFAREKADRLVLLGDFLYHGPRNVPVGRYMPVEVIEMLNGVKDKVYCVRGNCDAEVDQMVLEFPIQADYCLLPWGERMIFVTHGHLFNKNMLPPMQPGDILLHGHTHVPAWEEMENGCLYLNPGSVSMPKGGSDNSYMILEGNTFSWKNLAGEVYHELTV